MEPAIEKLIRFLNLEISKNYENRAVIGGLDKIIPIWESEARSANLNAAMVSRVSETIRAYPSSDSQERAQLIGQLLILLGQSRSGDVIDERKVPVSSRDTAPSLPKASSAIHSNKTARQRERIAEKHCRFLSHQRRLAPPRRGLYQQSHSVSDSARRRVLQPKGNPGRTGLSENTRESVRRDRPASHH